MVIHPLEISEQNHEVTVAAQIEFGADVGPMPEKLWFRVPQTYAEAVSPQHDGFLVALLLVAMSLGEDITIKGSLSPELYYNLDLIQSVYQAYLPRLFPHKARVQANEVKQDPANPAMVTSTFTAGVDSGYTVKRLLDQSCRAPQDRLSHCLFIYGFEHFQGDQAIYAGLAEDYRITLEELGITLLPMATNLYDFYRNRINWMHAHAAPLTGAALALGRGIKRFYKPSDLDAPHGRVTRPSFALNLFSTENTKCLTFEPHTERVGRLNYLKGWKPLEDHLRVCINSQLRADRRACYRCAKCLRVGLLLEYMGIRERYQNFPRPVKLGDIPHFAMGQFGFSFFWSKDVLKLFHLLRRYDMLAIYVLTFIPYGLKEMALFFFHRLLPERLKFKIKSKLISAPNWME